MYKIIGGDAKEYGPVTFDQLNQWITEGRANANSLVQGEGTAEWKPLGAFPEFEELLRKIAPPAPASSVLTASAAETSGGSAPLQAARLDLGVCFGEAWRVIKAQPVWVLATAGVVILVNMMAEKLLPVTYFNFPFHPQQSFPIPVWFSLFSLVFEGVLQGVVYACFLKLMRGEWTHVNQVLESMRPCWGSLIACSMVSNLLVGLGMLFFILPGIYLAISWTFAFLVIVDQKAGFWTAMERSRQAVRSQFWSVFLLTVVIAILVGIGAMISQFSRFILLPFAGLMMTSAYEVVCRRNLPSAGPGS
jgi:hypothetical protein